jgi:hypothetical protein
MVKKLTDKINTDEFGNPLYADNEDLTSFNTDATITDFGTEPDDWVDEEPTQQVEPEINDWVDEKPEAQPQVQAQPEPQPQGYANIIADSINKAGPEIGGRVDAMVRGGYDMATVGLGDDIKGQGAAFVGNMADLYYGNDPRKSDNLGVALDNIRKNDQTSQENYPNEYLGGQIGGAILTGATGAATKAGTAINNRIRSGLLPQATGKLGQLANLGTKAAQASLGVATSNALYGFNSGEGDFANRADKAKELAVPGGAIGAATVLAPAALRGTAKALTPVVDDGIKEVGRLAQKYNIPLSIDQITNSRFVKTAQRVSQEVPFSGQAGFRDKQITAWNKAVTKTLGEESDRITPEFIDNRFNVLGSKFNDLGKGEVFDPNNLSSKINSIIQDATDAGASKEAVKGFRGFVKRELSNVNPDGTISGEQLSRIRALANKTARNSNNFDSKTLYHNFESEIIDQLLPDTVEKQAFGKLKQQYKNLLVLEPLMKSEKGGIVSPTTLSNRMGNVFGREFYRGKAGELGELARVGKTLLPELGGSDTTQKLSTLGAVVTGATQPQLIPGMVAGVAANRAAQSGINRNQFIIRKLLGSTAKKAPSVAPMTAATIISKSNPSIIGAKVPTAQVDRVDYMLDNLRTGRIDSQNNIQRSPIFKDYIDNVMAELNDAQKGERYFKEAADGQGGSPEVVGFKGNFPEWFTQANAEGAGLSKKYINDVMAKAARGEKLASKEQSTFDAIKSRAEELMQADHSDLGRALSDYGLDVKSMSNKDIKAALKEIDNAAGDETVNEIPF